MFLYLKNFTGPECGGGATTGIDCNGQRIGAIRRLPYCDGNTNTTGGLRVTRLEVFSESNGDRPDVPNVCILLTDGFPTREVAELPDEVARIKAVCRVIGVGVTSAVSCVYLK